MIVDSHAHVFQTSAQGHRQKTDYVIHEYGEATVSLISEDGTLDDLVMHMQRAGVDRAFVLNLFAVKACDDGRVIGFYPGDGDGAPVTMDLDSARQTMMDLNAWCIGLAAAAPGVEPFIALDPLLLSGEALRSHLEWCIDAGAKGVKLHSLTQGFHASDRRMWDAYQILAEAGLPVVAHSGTGRGARAEYAVPRAFGDVAEAFPTLKLVIAHLGGGAWEQAASFAEEHPHVWFDCCEIIQWLGARDAPTPGQLSALIHAIGTDRVMLGSDFPWYGLDDCVNKVMELPGLSQDEQELILGANAMRLTRI